jgi:hypothetical protein
MMSLHVIEAVRLWLRTTVGAPIMPKSGASPTSTMAALLVLLAAAGSAPAGGTETTEPPLMPNLLLPPWPATFNLTKSSMTQSCFGPGSVNGPPRLTPETGAFLKQWGVVALDFESQEGLWAHHRPKDADVMMIEQAAVMKRMAPETQIWGYRNLVQPYANFVQLREKIEDPAYSGWFVHFGPGNNDRLTPRCEVNPRLNKTLCTDLFHTKLAWTENGHDCGDRIPCGDYVFDHRNQSLRDWIVNDYMMGPLGMGNRSAIDGFLLDDMWDLWSGPSEVPHFIQGTGLQPNSVAFHELYGNWSRTVIESLAAVRKAGGYTWSNVNCMLDPFYGKSCTPPDCPANGVYVGKSGVYGCGLTKTNGSPRANNVKTAPIWDGRSGNDQEKGETGKEGCAAWLREACDPSSVFGKIPTMLSFTRPSTPRRPHPAPHFPALLQDIARFMLVRGEYSWMGCEYPSRPSQRAAHCRGPYLVIL